MSTSTKQKLTNIYTYKENIRQAVLKKGVRISKEDQLSTYSTAIDKIKKIDAPNIVYNYNEDLPEMAAHWYGPDYRNGRYLLYGSSITDFSAETLADYYAMGLSDTTDMYYAFRECTSLRTIPDTIYLPKCLNAYGMFYNCYYLNPMESIGKLINISSIERYVGQSYDCDAFAAKNYKGIDNQTTTRTYKVYGYVRQKEYNSETGIIHIVFNSNNNSDERYTVEVEDFSCSQEVADSIYISNNYIITGQIERTWARQEAPIIQLASGCSLSSMFSQCQYMTCSPIIVMNDNIGNDCSSMYSNCYALANVDNICDSNIVPTSMNSMFSSSAVAWDSQLMQQIFDNIDLSKVTTMNSCFNRESISGFSNYISQEGDKEMTVNLSFPVDGQQVTISYLFSSGYNSSPYTNINLIWDFTCNSGKEANYLFQESYNNNYIDNKYYHGNTAITNLNLPYINSLSYAFYYCTYLTNISSITTGLNLKSTNCMFYYCKRLTSIPAFETAAVTSMDSMFYNCFSLTEIPALDMASCTSTSSMFYGCSALTAIHCRNIRKSIDISVSTLFTREALLEIIGNLMQVSSTQTLTMGSTNRNKLTAEDIAIATEKGWTIN